MDLHNIVMAAVIGVIEGLTEFLPVSSTGHMLLAEHFLGVKNQGDVFEIVIQFGAILAVVVLYFARLWRVALALPKSQQARHFALSVLVAFLPAAIIGAALHGFIKRVLFASPALIAWSLLIGGIAILVIERLPKRQKVIDAEAMPYKTAVGIGLCQCIAMIPGVSRSGATILGAMLLGVERKAAAEFSFFLSIPTMFGATVYDLYKNRADLAGGDMLLIVIGFVIAFFSALLVVRGFIAFITRHGFIPFAWYRIVLGIVVLIALALGN